MIPVSVVIITKNEEQNIARTLLPLQHLTDDIIVMDSGSTDKTIEIAQQMGANVFQTKWLGYGATKNAGNEKAKYNWILSIDADEVVDEKLAQQITDIFSENVNENNAFLIQRKMMYAGNMLHYGAVANEFRLRLFNKKNAQWNEASVHETIIFSTTFLQKKLDGFLLHYSYANSKEHLQRLEKYAQLFAQQHTKKVSVLKMYGSPIFNFIRNYFFKLGFLDGALGFQFAKNEMWYSYRKYQLLNSK